MTIPELIHHAVDPNLIVGWRRLETNPDVLRILARSDGELLYYTSECGLLSAACLENMPSSGEKHARRIADHRVHSEVEPASYPED